MTQNKKLALLIGVGTLLGGALGFEVQDRLLKRSKVRLPRFNPYKCKNVSRTQP